MRIVKKIFLISLLASCAPSVLAESLNQHIVVSPKCLLKKINNTYNTLSSTKNLNLIEIDEAGIDALIHAKENQHDRCGGFIDVTETWIDYKKQTSTNVDAKTFLNSYEMVAKKNLSSSYSVKYPNQVNTIIKQSNPQYMWTRLQELSTHQDRFFKSSEGIKVAREIKTEVEAMAKNNNRNDVSTFMVSTGIRTQPSVVVKIGTSNEAGIVIGAHMDTLSSRNEPKPGADDDGSGTVTVLEVARTLLNSGMHFKKPIYLVWYAAEEVGLIGSQHVVSYFQKNQIQISDVLQLDMTGYAYKNDMTMWLYDDYTDKDLTAYLETLINTYVKAPVKHDKCGYACSDHVSWTQQGIRASLPFEASFNTYNPDVHTSLDTIDKLSLDHMKDFSKLALAFAVELAEPV